MTLCRAQLADISLELARAAAGDTDLDCDEPLVVFEEADKLILDDGFKRVLTLREFSQRATPSPR